jgi:hypothetical protein
MRLGLLFLVTLAAGCDGGSGPSRLTVELSTTPTQGLPVPLSFNARAPQLTIAGTIDVNEPCYDFGASLETVRDTLLVRLRAERRDTPCIQEGARFAYTLTISGLERGVQPLRVLYDYRGPPTFVQVAFEGAVDIQ